MRACSTKNTAIGRSCTISVCCVGPRAQMTVKNRRDPRPQISDRSTTDRGLQSGRYRCSDLRCGEIGPACRKRSIASHRRPRRAFLGPTSGHSSSSGRRRSDGDDGGLFEPSKTIGSEDLKGTSLKVMGSDRAGYRRCAHGPPLISAHSRRAAGICYVPQSNQDPT